MPRFSRTAGRACQDASVKMRGTTVCPHCNTRFKITKAQLEAHHGMVRCGHCLQAFDTSPNFTPDQLDLQLELPILDKSVTSRDSKMAVLQPMTLAEQVAIVQDDDDSEFQPKAVPGHGPLLHLCCCWCCLHKPDYFFRVDLAAQLPALKPALIGYCRILKCTVPLPQHTDLISIESSGLEADPAKRKPDHPECPVAQPRSLRSSLSQSGTHAQRQSGQTSRASHVHTGRLFAAVRNRIDRPASPTTNSASSCTSTPLISNHPVIAWYCFIQNTSQYLFNLSNVIQSCAG